MDTSDFAPAYEASQRIQQKMLETSQQPLIADEAEPQKMQTGRMSLWETRKLNEHHQTLLRQEQWQQKHIETQIYREQKKNYIAEQQKKQLIVVDKIRQEVAKQREIKRIIKAEQNNELNKNLSVFLNLNNEERTLRQELVDKEHDLSIKEKHYKKANIIHQMRVRHLKREEREKFIGSFSQAKNLIEK